MRDSIRMKKRKDKTKAIEEKINNFDDSDEQKVGTIRLFSE